MKKLLIATSIIESVTGLALLASPALPVSLLLGVVLDTPGGLVAARVAGAALLALGLACWLASGDGGSRAAHGVVVAMLLYNAVTVAVLVLARVRSDLHGVGLWPAVLLHSAMAGWCIACMRPLTGQISESGPP